MAIQKLYGTDLLAGFRTKLADESLIARADLILVMQRTMLKALPWEIGGKAFVLKPFLGFAGDLKDPWNGTGNPSHEYDDCCRKLHKMLTPGLTRIVRFLEYRMTECNRAQGNVTAKASALTGA